MLAHFLRAALSFVPAYLPAGEYFVVATAAVDEFMRHQHNPEPAHTPPQSNFVNARTNADWFVRVVDDKSSGGSGEEEHIIRGRAAWHSKPIHVVVN